MWNNNPYHWFTVMRWLYSVCLFAFCLLHFLKSFYSIRFGLVSKFIIWSKSALNFTLVRNTFDSNQFVSFYTAHRNFFIFCTSQTAQFSRITLIGIHLSNCKFHEHIFVEIFFFFLYLHTWKLRSQLLFFGNFLLSLQYILDPVNELYVHADVSGVEQIPKLQ